MLYLTHKIALQPNKEQVKYFTNSCGVARFAYNWALTKWKAQYKASQSDTSITAPTYRLLNNELNSVKRDLFPWMYDVSKCAAQTAITQLGNAFDNFFAKRAGYPNFRRKGKHESFTLTADTIVLDEKSIRIPHIGWIRMRESLRFNGKVLSTTIVKLGTRWFACVKVQISDLAKKPISTNSKNHGAVNVDFPSDHLATLSTDKHMFSPPNSYLSLLKKATRLKRSLRRKKTNSSNYRKMSEQLSKLLLRIRSIRHDALHKLSHYLTSSFNSISMKDLSLNGKHSGKGELPQICNLSFHEFKRQMTYKAKIHGNDLIFVDKTCPNRTLCSNCNRPSVLNNSDNFWICSHCQHAHENNLSKAIKLVSSAVSSTVTACGKDGTGLLGSTPSINQNVNPPLLKQEVTTSDTAG